MNPINRNHIPLPRLRELFAETLIDFDYEYDGLSQLDIAINAPDSHFRLLHHILIARYAKVTTHHRDTPIPIVGLDIETDHTTGEPKLLGYSYPDNYYSADDSPTLESLFFKVVSILDNQERGTQLATWGNLDINCIIRMFSPTKEEQRLISKGYGGRFRNGEWINHPPLLRDMPGGAQFSIDHYIGKRSMRLSVVVNKRCRTIWIYNISQFFPTRIAATAQAMGYEWIDYEKKNPGEEKYTHLVDWNRYADYPDYRKDVLKSNEQDARIVRLMANHWQNIFHKVFDAYPSLLVSAGSLADAAVSKMLNQEEYESNSWQYLKYSTFGIDNPIIPLAENLLSEAYSAGYVDQFSIGYHKEAHTADISSAYPHKIRQLPDLRHCVMYSGEGSTYETVKNLINSGMSIFTIVYRGLVHIPESLEYHPITVRTPNRLNFRPIGSFRASYFQEEREFCKKHGAKFSQEEWVIFALKERVEAPIARVSKTLAEMRTEYTKLRDSRDGTDAEFIFYDSLQNMVKIVDNSLYGKNVMAVEIVEEIDGKPVVVGLKAGDRFNKLYGGWITACTRTQIAASCMMIQSAGGSPLLAMTDAIYWTGKKTDISPELISFHGKEAGKFEPPETVNDFFLVKTGQYECRKGRVFIHKVRGLNLPYESMSSDRSFYRATIKEWLDKNHYPYMHAEDVQIPVQTRKLITVGMHDLEHIGLVSDGVAMMKPFILSAKQVERFVENYMDTLNGAIRLRPAIVKQDRNMDSPLEFLSGLNLKGGEYLTRHEKRRMFYHLIVKITGMTIRNRFKGRMPANKARLSDCSWEELEEWSGIKRAWVKI